MKISYRTHPILKTLKDGKLGTLPICEEDKTYFSADGKRFINHWKGKCNKFSENVYYISKPFMHAAEKSWQKLSLLYMDIQTNNISDINISGTYILGDFVFMFYHETKKDSEDVDICLYKFTKDGMPICYYVNNPNTLFGWASKTQKVNNQDINHYLIVQMSICVTLHFFKSYASVETKFLPPNKRVKDIECKYINSSDLPITHLDSTWFTNLVKSDAFTVRGHFRLQPKKQNGKWTKELIWIDEFEKSGYTRKSKKDTTNLQPL